MFIEIAIYDFTELFASIHLQLFNLVLYFSIRYQKREEYFRISLLNRTNENKHVTINEQKKRIICILENWNHISKMYNWGFTRFLFFLIIKLIFILIIPTKFQTCKGERINIIYSYNRVFSIPSRNFFFFQICTSQKCSYDLHSGVT